MAEKTHLTKVKAKSPLKRVVVRTEYSLSDVTTMERKCLEKANKAISAIENAIAVWDAAKEKPAELEPRLQKMRYFHDSLSVWEKKMLKAMTRKEDINTRIQRLREFSDICYTYSQ